MVELIYQSLSTRELSTQELISLTNAYRSANERYEITGVLIYHNRTFVQLLEGEEQAINNLFDNIKKDPLNTNVKLSWKSEIEERGFSEWSMAFIDLSSTCSNIKGYSNYLTEGILTGDIQGVMSTSKSLLKSMSQEFMVGL